jgi:hypothetical protein
MDYFDALDKKKMSDKGLGFATPVPVMEKTNEEIKESLKKSERSGGRHGNILT